MPVSRVEDNESVVPHAQSFKEAPRACVMTRRRQREVGIGLPLTPKISRTLCVPASQHAAPTEKVAVFTQHLEDAPCTSTPKITRDSSVPLRISRTLHVPESRRAENTERVVPYARVVRMLHAPVSRRAENKERVATYAQNFEDAPRSSDMTHCATERLVICTQNFADAPRTSTAARRKQREGGHLHPEFRGRSAHQRHATHGSPTIPNMMKPNDTDEKSFRS